MVAVTLWLALTSDHLERPVAAGSIWAYLIAASMAIGSYWWTRRPASRFGPLLVAFGILVWVVSWQAADLPLAFDIGVLAEAPFFVLTFYLFLRVPDGPARAIGALAHVGARVRGRGVLPSMGAVLARDRRRRTVDRLRSGLPQNVLQVGSAPTLVEVAGKGERTSPSRSRLVFVATWRASERRRGRTAARSWRSR